MAENTNIEWTDATWQIVTGCDIESPGCKNCYAMKLAGGRLQHHPSRIGLTKPSAAGPVWTGEVRFNEQWLRQPLEWKRPRMIFVAAHGDLFYPGVSDAVLDKVFAVMALAKHHTHQVLTKRTARAAEYLAGLATPAGLQRLQAAAWAAGYTFEFQGHLLLDLPLRNVWIGTSVEDQRYADQRREPLRAAAALGWLTWVSYEPALGPVDWTGWEFIRWMVSGGESGIGARPHLADWHRATRDYCAEHGIAYLFKQWGNHIPVDVIDPDPQAAEVFAEDGSGRQLFGRITLVNDLGTPLAKVDKHFAGRLLDGKTHDGFPEVRHG